MLEYTGAGDGARLMMLVMHDDAKREYAYGAIRRSEEESWTVISMKNDWKRIFAFEQAA